MTAPTLLVVAKAPEPGLAKTRLAGRTGADVAARFAAAAFLDTLETVSVLGWPVVVALTGDLTRAARGDDLRAACAPHRVVAQRGTTFGQRLVNAHEDADAGAGVVQIGTDTPQATTADLIAVADGLQSHEAVLGPAADGGWWALGVRSPRWARPLSDVAMSRSDTGARTYAALTAAGARVGGAPVLTDVDTWEDALALVRTAPRSRAGRVIAELVAGGVS
ncbi:DUF2064 domain-containing protein [Mumia sp. zg.B17]|uniref:TIGR04282 family arsenosugar biosynthesis glycosyltransferase n=1 Tax=Mumia sp. zg.B17 TaxID=2855446 RepID=UPI001C6E9D63|nr:DUF2064 domain-containing protein [Mumia sp. zg.B17]MBW9205433.1 DUF2064 domain-containing protein [Mumia sp. zg.B17]